ncbi:hypothetical protein [Pectinatus brassicae]|uniref:Deoxyadenosine/deoxycytidine kinase n=1 Tax=Pectinatus brassicae TaxID=862415 RepID=A0A840UBB2_9FIRM|nr:hypothetical protein [Pectinatus brassicae]MBB5334991.1 deoxyadenosine/deoxycytidine kinase [Pectinatus brassicae]
MIITVVGICASGKSTLVKGLRNFGYDAHNIAQEHSCVQKLWQKNQPDLLILLDAQLVSVQKRRRPSWTQERIDIQHERLLNARENCNLYIQTDTLSIDQVLTKAIDYIKNYHIIAAN